ncbi:MerR family transcriptional regulator [Prauserella marina]|uniref:DNA-binding transcriptional regulator, MerR family n=1 Tax=Prauserella marina TaxID=530584 RepID=A0A222VV82_9PSEU|nr:MerR family transcriptional regulator [Prauserella marina]ASR37805.1 MerR family transcriptional regulator [Prauserella marina]PWV75765.1 DNA-binding transcriptional MerR regulator [Prauserella marina]SDD26737.1 DNA-binding transcriptional regulator, MerR family [Prauserella marina]
MLIGELSTRTGVSARLLRYYEQQGLLSSERTSAGYRVYGEDAVTQVRQIRSLLSAGLSTETIGFVLPCTAGWGPDGLKFELCPDLVRTLRDELAAQDAKLDELMRTRSTLAAYVAAGD